MLYQKLHFLDNYCLEFTRRFMVKGREDHEDENNSFRIVWSRCFEASVWDIRSESIRRKTLTGELIDTLKQCGVDMKDFELKITLFLKAYRAHMRCSLDSLRECIGQDQREVSHQLFDVLGGLTQISQRSRLRGPDQGYDLSALVSYLPHVQR